MSGYKLSLLLLCSHKMNTTVAENGLPSHSSLAGSHNEALVMASTSINSILCLPLNGYVIWLILAGARETLASDFFALNLAISEIFFSLSNMWYFLFALFESFFCFEAQMFSLGLLFTARPLFQCCICAECYVGVVHPVSFLRFKPLRYRVAFCCVVWLIVLVSCIYSRFTYSKAVYLYGFFAQNLLFFSILLFCCLSVLRALKRPGPGEKYTEKRKSNTMKRKAFKIILLILISMVINFFLYVAAIPLQCCVASMEFTSSLTVCTGLALITGFIQPLLYLHRARKLFCFREF